MSRVFLTPFVIAGLLFLPSCSSSSNPADKPQAKTECEVIQEKSLELAAKAENEPLWRSKQRDYLTWFNYIIQESDCFSSEIVAQAKSNMAVVLANIANQ